MSEAAVDQRLLIVNADDFGQSPGINEGIIEGFENGIVTSASLMVRWAAAEHAAAYSREHASLSVGLHVDLGEWVCRDGAWVSLYEVVPTTNEAAVYGELWTQIEMFFKLVGRLPTHLDSHQHVHRSGFIARLFEEAALTIGVPLRDANSSVRYCGAFYGQTADGLALPDNLSMAALNKIIDNLKPGFTELGCHPAKSIDLNSGYGQRVQEFEILSNPALREVLAEKQVRLRSFHDVSGASR